MLDKKRNRIGIIVSAAFVLTCVLVGAFLLFNRQYVVDQLSVWGYTPSSSVQSIIERVEFSPAGEFYFKTAHPMVVEADEFNKSCPQREINSPVLGCYTTHRIFIYDIQKEELDGIKEVTAAHEMLHSAWDRLSPSEKTDLEKLLTAELAKVSDSEFHERMDYYERHEPGELINELHSIIGTEISSLSPELENYYKRYFEDRSVILKLHENYNSVFRGLKAEATSLYDDLVILGKSIQARSAAYERAILTLAADINQFNRRAEAGDFASVNQFNSERAVLMSRGAELDRERQSLNQDISTYNKKYNQYQRVAFEIQSLNDSINSMRAPSEVPSFE